MSKLSAIIFVPDDTGRTGLDKPLMLTDMMNCPVLRWITEALNRVDVSRFFLVCHEKHVAGAKLCFPEGAEVMTSASDSPADLLHVFLSTADDEESTAVCITRPIILLSAGADSLTKPLPEPEPVTFPHLTIKRGEPKPEPIDTGIFVLRGEALMDALDGDFHFRAFLTENGIKGVEGGGALPITCAEDILALQSKANLDVITHHAKNGVNIWDAGNCYIGPTVKIGKGTTLLPGCIISGSSEIGDGCEIGPNSRIENCRIGDNTTVNASQLFESSVGDNVKIGPYAYVRPNCQIGNDIKIGDFVEIKNSKVGDGTKISHLTYVGDSDLGNRVNLGCGTVTVNFDGTNKFRTTVEDEAFVGCNTNLIAPVTVGKGAYIAAGSTISGDVPAEALAIARSRQTVKKDWVIKRKLKNK